jgi:cysteine desulfurase/selenocysteine lyase
MTLAEKEKSIIEDFSVYSDWMEKYEYIIELGKELKPLDEKYKVQENVIKGCQSTVWMHAEKQDGKIIYTADGDAIITKGLIALFKVDVQKLDCDFLVFSGHKLFGPTGTGVLYGKETILNAMPPYQGGGDMIKTVSMQKTVYNELPHKFEAGTPNISGGICLGVAVDWLSKLDLLKLEKHETELLDYATNRIKEIDGVKIYGEAKNKCSILSFLIGDLHPYDLGTLLNQQGVAVRTGHHCTQPVMDYFKIPGTIRASFAFYNTKAEVDFFIDALKRAVNMLR